MPLSKNQEKEVLQVYDTWLDSYLNGDVETYNSYFDDEFHFIGSTNNEEFLNRKHTTEFFRATADQLSGKAQLRNESKIIEQFGDLVFITHLFDAWFHNGKDSSFYSRFRFTNALRKNGDGWRFIYQHYSTPDTKAQEGETIGFDQVSVENQQLREAVKRRTFELEQKNRELEIESALERVRYRAVAMRHSDELSEAAELLYKEFLKMGVESFSCGYLINDEDKQEWKVWLTNPGEPFFKEFWTVPYAADQHLKARYDSWQDRDEEAFHCAVLTGEENRSHHMVISKYAPWKAEMLDDLPAQLVFNSAHFSMGHLLVISPERLSSELEQAMVRFAGVFDLAYLRFLDLKKAEEQAREAQIESALERIRAQVSSMQESSDLLDIVVAMRNEFVRLGHEAGYFWHMRWHPEKYEKAMTSGDGTRIGMVMELPRRIHGEIPVLAAWEKGDEPTVVFPMDVDATLDYVQKMGAWGDFERIDPNMPTEDDIRHIGGLTYVMARTSLGEIGYSLPGIVETIPKTELDTLVRFARAFDLAHKRFEDLKASERQARETQIELALEKVRNRTMAMDHSDELPEAANLLFTEVQSLGIPAWSCGYNILSEDKKYSNCIMSSEGELQIPFILPLTEHESLRPWHEAIINREEFFVYWQEGNDLVEHYDYMKSLPELKATFEQFDNAGIDLPSRQFNHLVRFPQGFLLFITYEAVPEAHDIFKRFGKVFEQTYTRFLDLQKAEAQAREARIELSLERIRSQVTAMQESSDLFDIVVTMRKEFLSLGHEADYFWHMRWMPDQYEMSMTSEDGNRIGMIITVPKFVHDAIPSLAAWEKSMEPAFVLALDAEGAWDYIDKMNTYGRYEQADPNAPTQEDIQHIGGLTFIIARTTHGEIGFSLPGKITAPPQESVETLIRFAAVFDLAYKRFEDLKATEQQTLELLEEKQRLEKTLKDLQATQKQLIQSEKMASLGELTAGIAHEIQNPLNFVNNFSEVSTELLDEMNEEIENGDLDEVKAIAHDIKLNLQKINHHGKRADTIVKGMLQHSRKSSGEKTPTDINQLADEYLRLAYHGLRAKDKTFNAQLDTALDPALEKIEVIPQDIGRVLLNLITNAFFTVSEKKKQSNNNYQPTVTIGTEKMDDHIIITVKDNGNGIPQTVLDKIFQPFFTTKPTGQGTGLGLSLSYDIIKAHGGEIKVKSKINEGTEFTVVLPNK